LAKASTLALVSMAVIVVTVVVQGMMVPAADKGTLKDWRLLVINDGIFQAIGVISFGRLPLSRPTSGITVQC
jgi:sodium-coupled neutral amino acid transporter 11